MQRVGRDVGVAHGVQVKTNSLLELVDGDCQTQTDIGQFTDDKHADNDEQHHRHVGLTVSSSTGARRQQTTSTTTQGSERCRQTSIDDDENQQRTY